MKNLITLIILLFTINIYSQNRIIDQYNITKICYVEDTTKDTNSDVLDTFGQITVTENNIQVNIENKLNITLVIVSEIEEGEHDGKEFLYCRALLDDKIYVDLVLINNQSMFINYDDKSSLALLFE